MEESKECPRCFSKIPEGKQVCPDCSLDSHKAIRQDAWGTIRTILVALILVGAIWTVLAFISKDADRFLNFMLVLAALASALYIGL